MTLPLKTYQNSTELANLNGAPIYMADMVDAALRGQLNVFLQGDTGSGKSQLLQDVRNFFGQKSFYLLGRNDMDTRELFRLINPEFLKALREGRDTSNMKLKELAEGVNYHLFCIDELPNCVPSVRAQLFNLFDGFVELEGRTYALGSGYCMGMAAGNIGQQFTESSNEVGRALKDRMHLIIDTDMYRPQPRDTMRILTRDTNPRVQFSESLEDKIEMLRQRSQQVIAAEIPLEKLIIAQYLLHGLDYIEGGKSKIAMKSGWPNKVEQHEKGSDAALILPVSPRAAKSILRTSQALDQIAQEKEVSEVDPFDSMTTAFKFVSAYSGILNDALVRSEYDDNRYSAMDAVIAATRGQFEQKKDLVAAAVGMAVQGKKSKKLFDEFGGRWSFMKDLLENYQWSSQ